MVPKLLKTRQQPPAPAFLTPNHLEKTDTALLTHLLVSAQLIDILFGSTQIQIRQRRALLGKRPAAQAQ